MLNTWKVDRQQPPLLGQFDKHISYRPEELELDNGNLAYLFNLGTIEYTQIEIVYEAGAWYHENAFVPAMTAELLLKGTSRLSANSIAEKFDYYGVSIKSYAEADRLFITVGCLNKYCFEALKLVSELLNLSVFPDSESELLISRKEQNLKVMLQKSNYVAKTALSKSLYGENHPYGFNLSFDVMSKFDVAACRDFFGSHIKGSTCKIFVSGKLHANIRDILNDTLGNLKVKAKPAEAPTHSLAPSKEYKQTSHLKGAVQSAIQIGFETIPISHPDFKGLLFLNKVLGGYFGSRLMSNIREEKGYTYGIYSSLRQLRNSTVIQIGTETSIDKTDLVLNEIYKEINRLKTEPIPEEELSLVKNYTLGSLLNTLDGPYKISSTLIALDLSGLNLSFNNEMAETYKNIQAKHLLELANKYFDTDKMYQVVVS